MILLPVMRNFGRRYAYNSVYILACIRAYLVYTIPTVTEETLYVIYTID